jgi:hypothetical protein
MNIIKHCHNAFLNLDWPSKIIVNLFLFALLITVIESLYSVYKYSNSNYIAGTEYLGLPSYNGPCPDLMAKAYNIFKQTGEFEETIGSSKSDDLKNYTIIRNQMINVTQLSQFCEDPEAQGRILYIQAAVELIGGTRGLRPMNNVIYNASSFYNQADNLGYNKIHPDEAFWLYERIERNAHRANIKINLVPPPVPIPESTKIISK